LFPDAFILTLWAFSRKTKLDNNTKLKLMSLCEELSVKAGEQNSFFDFSREQFCEAYEIAELCKQYPEIKSISDKQILSLCQYAYNLGKQ
jgi:hypothetical protein